MHFNYGGGSNEEENENPNYELMIDTFRSALARFASDKANRERDRNMALEVPSHIDYISIIFQDQFQQSAYQSWYNDFGLMGVHFSNFNHQGLFSVVDLDKFQSFLNNIRHFIQKESGERPEIEYQAKVRFIQDFRLLSTADIIGTTEFHTLMNLKLFSYPLEIDKATEIRDSLGNYLDERDISFEFIEGSNVLELQGGSAEIIEEIAKNYDVVLNVTSSLSAVVRPTELNTVERAYGFTISNGDEELPIIGILDTGISSATPLGGIIINDTRFNLTNSNPLTDNADHGTAVGALAAMGRTPYLLGYRGAMTADAKLLSMKIMDDRQADLSQKSIIELSKKAKDSYPAIKIFVLAVGYNQPKPDNSQYSSYAFLLDKFAHENDCLIFIATTNNEVAGSQRQYSLNYFTREESNICVPAESMNNVVIGAAADNLKVGIFHGISPGREYPTIYTRKSSIDLVSMFSKNKRNKNLFKPDVIESGGDWEQGAGFIGTGEDAVMEVLSSNPAFGFLKSAGTSYSAPLAANTAAKILGLYPGLKAQTIKALILNAASLDKIPFDDQYKHLKNRIAGHGLSNPDRSIYSSENRVSFIVEEEINPEEMKIFPLNFPAYLTDNDLVKKVASIKITATLCFSFDPVQDNHLSYCPIQMAFAIFRNHTSGDILKTEEEIKSKLRESWSQNNRFKSKPIPASNSQKVQFTAGTNELLGEDYTFKLAVHCRISEQLFSGENYNYSHPFSMVITIEENQSESKLTGRLYDEIIAINEVENIIETDVDLEGTLENE
jgi:hypothetical protein